MLWEEFDKYWKGELSAEERDVFQKKMNADPLIREDFEQYHQIISAIISREKEQLKSQLKITLTRQRKKEISLRRKAKIFLTAAASVSLLLMTVNHLTFHTKIYKRYALPYHQDNLMGDSPPFSELINPDNALLLRKALALKKGGRLDEAVGILEKIEITSSDRYHDYFVAQYELALIYVEKKEFEKSRQILKLLIERPENDFIKMDAEKLLEGLSKIPAFYF